MTAQGDAVRLGMQLMAGMRSSWIDGRPFDGVGNGRMGHRNPANGDNLGDTDEADAALVDQAVVSARACYERAWGRLTPFERKTLLLRFAQVVDDHASELSLLEMLEVGRPISDAGALNAGAGNLIRTYAAKIDTVHGDMFRAEERRMGVVMRRPRGVVGAIIPWNVPGMNVLLRVAPALAAGNTIVIKTSELCPRVALLLARCATEAGLPDGAFNVVLGAGSVAGAALAGHHDLNLVAFTGSTQTGHAVAQAAARTSFKPVLLECGGKSPQVVLDDVFDDVGIWNSLFFAAFWNTGQWCVAKTRLIIPRSRERDAIDGLSAAAKAWQVGDPSDPATRLGPLASRSQHDRVSTYFDKARSLGDVIDLGCPRGETDAQGCYISPSVVVGLPSGSVLSKEEVFGPLMTIELFDDIDHAIELANDTDFGLSASIWTARSDYGYKLARNIKAGGVAVYSSSEAAKASGPELGTARYFEPQKQSGMGLDGGEPGYLAYTTAQSIYFHN